MELRNYETLFILTPVLSEQQVKDTIDKFRNFFKKKKAEIVHEEHMGLKQLAYPIQHKSAGFYQLFEFKATPAIINLLEIEYKREEKIIRFLTVALDKHGVEHNEKKRKGAFDKKTKEETAT
ncbi:MAG: 30S ribosomal protein S6 [Cytophagales bacterium]|nr:30S ribosomal protein S6 [Cytophagales bacterium]